MAVQTTGTTAFLRALTRRGLRGVKLVIADAHEGLKAAVRKAKSATWQRCRVHFMRNVPVHAPAGQRRMVSALIATIFAQETEAAARDQWRIVADQLRERFPKIARLLDDAEPAHFRFTASLGLHPANSRSHPEGCDRSKLKINKGCGS